MLTSPPSSPSHQVLIHDPGRPSRSKPSDAQWSWCHMVTATVSFFCCECFGLAAVILALLAYTDHKAKDYERSAVKRRWSLGCSIAALVVGTIAVVGVLIMIPVALRMNEESMNQNWDDKGL